MELCSGLSAEFRSLFPTTSWKPPRASSQQARVEAVLSSLQQTPPFPASPVPTRRHLCCPDRTLTVSLVSRFSFLYVQLVTPPCPCKRTPFPAPPEVGSAPLFLLRFAHGPPWVCPVPSIERVVCSLFCSLDSHTSLIQSSTVFLLDDKMSRFSSPGKVSEQHLNLACVLQAGTLESSEEPVKKLRFRPQNQGVCILKILCVVLLQDGV